MTKPLRFNQFSFHSHTPMVLCSSVSKLEASQSEIFDEGLFVLSLALTPTNLLASINVIYRGGMY